MRSQLLVLFIFFLGMYQSGYSQRLTEFSATQDEYMKELETFMTSSKRQVMEDVFEAFEKQFKGAAFTEEEFVIIHETSNAMLAQKMTASPYFSSYLETLTIIKKGEDGAKVFIEWHEILKSLLADIENRKLNPFKDYLEFSTQFFLSKTLRYSTSGVNWIAVADKFDLKYENNEPIISYDKLDLVGFRKQDSIKILETSGIYFPNQEIWKGNGGKVEWDRFGLKDSIHVILSDYELETKKSLYEVKSVKLFYPELFPNGGVEGTFTDKIVASSNSKGESYPRFESKDSILQINNIGGGIQYVGGFRLNGTTVYGYGSKDLNAKIAVYDDGKKLQFRGAAELFVIRKGERIAGEGVETTLYFDQDSFYHPSVNLKFDIPNKELNLFRGDRGSDRNPFFNSLHQVNIDVENIDWYLEKDSLVFGQTGVGFAKTKKTASFESLKYFEQDDYIRLQNISSTNPIAMIKVYADQEGDLLNARNLAKKMNPKYEVSSIQSLLYDLVAKGFVNYDSDKGLVFVKDKVFHYADASQGKVDYDLLKILSKSDSTNAVMSLKDFSIQATGVTSIQFSKTQKVAVRPFYNKITLKRNRNLDFDGRVFAGFGLFEGKDFSFIYDKNHIELDSVRFFDLFIPTGAVSKEGVPEALSIGSRIEHSTGVLLIDAPANKSGKEDIPIFPSYQSKGPSYVYYDYEGTQGGAYKRDSFYFELDKFSFNSLDRFSKADIEFKGKMVSAGIFPDFTETLVLQEDESLGFVSEKPKEGFPIYAEKGDYVGDVSISNEGFLGKGSLNYLTADVNSEDFIFKPKQMLATAERFDLKEDRGEVKIPNALGLDVNIDWKPYQDSMYVTTKEKAFEIFSDNNHTLDGTLILTPDGLRGRGVFDWDKGILKSNLISFGVYSAVSDTADIRIKAIGEDALALNTDNVNANLDFESQIGRIKANAEDVETVMPFNQYQTSLNDYVWNMKEENVTFKNDKGDFGTFTSIHPDQDSLIFEGKTAFYDLKTNELKIGGVEVIETCDALVYLEDGKVEVNKGAKMTTLENAKIIANTINRYHVINRATVDILGKKDYRAKGFYEYNIGDKKQEIEFADIIGTRVGKGKRSEKETVTRATGEVKEDAGFYIDHKTEYRGKISLNAESKNLEFDGFARLDVPEMARREWFSVKFEGDKNDLAIQYEVPKNYLGDPLRTGIFVSKTSAKIYPSIMMPLYVRKDRKIFEARGENEKGIFKYNKKDDRFIFGDSLLMTDGTLRGNELIYANKNGKITAEGKMDIGSGLDYISITAAGRIETSFADAPVEPTEFPEPGDTKVSFELMAGIDAIIPDKLLKIMATDIQASSFDARIVDYLKDEDLYKKALSEFIPAGKDFDSALNKMKNVGLDLPGKYDKFELFFSYLPMEWNPELQSLISSQEKVGLCSVGGEVINRLLDCYVEFKMPTNEDDRVYIYIKSPSGNFYFFGYKQGILNCVSSNDKFNAEVEALKKKEKVIKMDDGGFYEIALVDQGSAQMFVNRIRSAKAGN
jgi:hypothetical protein